MFSASCTAGLMNHTPKYNQRAHQTAAGGGFMSDIACIRLALHLFAE
jgi:hypothetical protein